MLWQKDALEQVSLLSGQQVLDVDINQSNRFCVLLNTARGKNAYYFSTPIYNLNSGKLVRRRFREGSGGYRFTGSRAELAVSATEICLTDGEKKVSLRFGRQMSFRLQNGHLVSDSLSLIPTFNGVLLEGETERLQLQAEMNFSCGWLRASKSTVCIMEGQFRPILVMSALLSGKSGADFGPAAIAFDKRSDHSGRLRLLPGSTGGRGMLEINFYEPKLIQDTPVSGGLPGENNAFGPVAFPGKTSQYGTQWLYSRLDLGKLPELNRKWIQSITLYIPKYSARSMSLSFYALSNRFCSFGSNWSNKVALGTLQQISPGSGAYLELNLTSLYVNRNRLQEAEGFVMVPQRNTEHDFLAVSTGDCYAMPQIVCVKYLNR